MFSSSLTYDVFLSFRGEDTRHGFTGNLYKALCDRGIHTFIDDGDLQSGEEITAALQKAIEESRIAIVVLSQNYASSSFCLDELATILHCQSKGLLVIPVFYKVDPSYVRHQKGSYGEALSEHERRFKNLEKVKKWRMALHQVADFSGYLLEDRVGYEYKIIEGIVEHVYKIIIRAAFVHTAQAFQMIETKGMGGVGKSTLARAVYCDSVGENFGELCFLKKPREKTNKHEFKHLQSEMITSFGSHVSVKGLELIKVKDIPHAHYDRSNCLPFALDNLFKKFVNLTIVNLSGLPNLKRLSSKDMLTTTSFPPLNLTPLEEKWESAINQYDSVGQESRSDAFSYDVFLSFRGLDTLYGFTGYLYKALHDSGIHTFIDDENLQRGEEITPTIVKAIEESRIAITVLSINSASSTACLDELATILDCLKRKRLLVLPVFYYVDPTQVRLEKGSFGEALTKHEKRLKHNMKKLFKWKMALHQVANLFFFHIDHGNGYEYEFIGEIVEWVSKKINPAHYPVGIESKVQEVMKLLDVGFDGGVHMIGIHGIGGVGKSTLAKEVYNNLISDKFDASCFIENAREKSSKHGLQYLQSTLLLKLLGEKDMKLTSVQQGISVIQRRLRGKKVLLILDDVDSQEQLQAVVGRADWFGSGSRVIITTRDEQLLASHNVQTTYEVKGINSNDALQLFKWKAFKKHYFDPRYEKLLNRVVTFAAGIPLALEVIGSNLYGKSVKEWKSVIHKLKKCPNNPVETILKASFDSLEEKERSVFLDIACCFKGYELAEVEDILQAHYGQNMKCYIDLLVDKSLVKRSHGTKPCYDRVTLHDLIEDMGKDIVRQESLTEPGENSRLWLLKDVRQVLENNRGTSKIEIICLDFPIFDQEEIVEWDGKAFQNMQNLKTLIIKKGSFSKGPEYLPDNLKVLEWWRYPSNCLPSDFHPKELAICKLPCSSISTIELTNLLKKLVNLRVFKFSNANV